MENTVNNFPLFQFTEIEWNIPKQDEEIFSLPEKISIPLEYYPILKEKGIEQYFIDVISIPYHNFIFECNMKSLEIQDLIDKKTDFLKTLNPILHRDLYEQIKKEIYLLECALQIQIENQNAKEKQEYDLEL